MSAIYTPTHDVHDWHADSGPMTGWHVYVDDKGPDADRARRWIWTARRCADRYRIAAGYASSRDRAWRAAVDAIEAVAR